MFLPPLHQFLIHRPTDSHPNKVTETDPVTTQPMLSNYNSMITVQTSPCQCTKLYFDFFAWKPKENIQLTAPVNKVDLGLLWLTAKLACYFKFQSNLNLIGYSWQSPGNYNWITERCKWNKNVCYCHVWRHFEGCYRSPCSYCVE